MRVRVETVGGEAAEYDHVVIASQANQALRMLSNPTPAESATLGAFRYVRSAVVLHSDARVMPAERDDWKSINFATVHKAHETVTSATNYMNRLLPALAAHPRDVFQTWNPPFDVGREHVISVSVFERPVVSLDTRGDLEVPGWCWRDRLRLTL